MNLVPVRPPGPNARKARAFANEILQLRVQGYTFEAIREALAGAGVHVSNSTVQREVARAAGRATANLPVAAAASHREALPQPLSGGESAYPAATRASPALPASPASPASPSVPCDEGARRLARGLGGKENAEAFFNAHHSNPLFPTKENS